jgi:hypothetical protein
MSNIVVLPNDYDTAEGQLDQLLKSTSVLFIVFSGGPNEQNNADELANTAQEYSGLTPGWQVVQINDDTVSSALKTYLATKPDPDQLFVGVDMQIVAALVTSVDDKICALLKKPYSAITNSMVRKAWYTGDSA